MNEPDFACALDYKWMLCFHRVFFITKKSSHVTQNINISSIESSMVSGISFEQIIQSRQLRKILTPIDEHRRRETKFKFFVETFRLHVLSSFSVFH